MVHGIMPIFPASLVWGIGSFSLRNDPNAFTPEDQRDMHYARAILHGEDVQAQWCGMIAPLAAPAVDNLLAQVEQHGDPFSFTAAVRRRYRWPEASAVTANVGRVGHAALGLGRPQRCWRSLRMRARSRRWAARTSGWRALALRQVR